MFQASRCLRVFTCWPQFRSLFVRLTSTYSLGLNLMQLIIKVVTILHLSSIGTSCHVTSCAPQSRVSFPPSWIWAHLWLASINRMLQKGWAWASAVLQASASSLGTPLSPCEQAWSGLRVDPIWGHLRPANPSWSGNEPQIHEEAQLRSEPGLDQPILSVDTQTCEQ